MTTLAIPRAKSPAQAGISAQALRKFMDAIVDQGLDLHSVMVIRHGQVAYEDFRAPYTPHDPHILYSVSKSITAIAVGYAVHEGLLSVNSKVADLLPELRSYDMHPNLEKLKVFHLLTNSAGKKIDAMVDRTKKQWVRDFAQGAWDYIPGEGFNYCNENTYLLCAILCRVIDESSVTDFLMPRLFAPLGIERPYWETDGCGVETGGWGLSLRTEDLAKIAMCFLDEGKFQDRQVIPRAWVRDASAKQVSTSNNGEHDDGKQGYGYCIWHNVFPGLFRFDGMFCQFAWMFPAHDACVVTTGGELDMAAVNDAFQAVLPDLFDEKDKSETEIPKLPAYRPLGKAPRNATLEKRLNRACIHFPKKRLGKAMNFPLSMMPAMVFFMAHDKAGGIDNIHLRFEENTLRLSWSEGQERNTVLCGMDGKARKCKITLGGVEFVMSCSAAWEGDKLNMRLRCVNAVAERQLSFWFGPGRMVRMLPRSDPGLHRMTGNLANAAREIVKNPMLGELAARAAEQVQHIAEPLHVGYMR